MNKTFIDNDRPDLLISESKLDSVVRAILARKYSWACVSFLYSVGLNPLDYIPYRTYYRLIKNNCDSSI